MFFSVQLKFVSFIQFFPLSLERFNARPCCVFACFCLHLITFANISHISALCVWFSFLRWYFKSKWTACQLMAFDLLLCQHFMHCFTFSKWILQLNHSYSWHHRIPCIKLLAASLSSLATTTKNQAHFFLPRMSRKFLRLILGDFSFVYVSLTTNSVNLIFGNEITIHSLSSSSLLSSTEFISDVKSEKKIERN